MGNCKEFQGCQGLADYLNQCEELRDLEDVTYKKWVSTDRTKLVAFMELKEEFIENLASQVEKLTRHTFIAKSQS